MSILEILSRHIADVCNHGDIECRCGEQCDTPEDHRTHLSQVLEQHEREAKAEALEEAIDALMAGPEANLNPDGTMRPPHLHRSPRLNHKPRLRVANWLLRRAAQYKATS